ncbi:unnamed protein product [Orchesella dallaii]|uniref:2'-5'-oligoadenylate synthetase 1 domain-containing protein n=1 Tax=Orchesella dallaii TaxID=48710 RepID=A0ABP1S649_9HEXA
MAAEGKQHDILLREFGESLKCSEEFYEEGKRLAQRVFLKLQSDSQYSVSSVHFGGSFGKKTDVVEPDLDLVVVCNEVAPPPLPEVLVDFKNVLDTHKTELKISPDPIKKKKRALKFYFQNGIEVDLLPAATIEDADEVIEKIKKDPRMSYYYSPSLVDIQVAFLKSQSEFAHTLIRLVKFWFKSLYFGEKVYGGSAMMELLSVAASEDEEKYESRSMLRAFESVLAIITQLDTLKLAYRSLSDDNDKWERVPVNELQQGNCKQIVLSVVGNKEKLLQKYFIIEPANPFQDFLAEMKPAVINNFKKFAFSTQTVLKLLVDNKRGRDDFIVQLFQPQPSILAHVSTFLAPNVFCIDYAITCSSIVCESKVRKETVMQDKRKKDAIKVLKARIFSTVNAVVRSNPDNVTVNTVREAVKVAIEKTLEVKLVPARDSEMDVALTIPYRIKDEGYAVRFGMSWK